MLTLQPWADRWVRERIARREALSATVRTERRHLDRIIELHGARPLGQLGRWLVNEWASDQHHLAPSTWAARWRLHRRFFAWLATETGAPDPMAGIARPRSPRGVPRSLEGDTVAKLIAAAPHSRARAAIALMVHMGLRRAEVCALTHENWNRGRRTMTVTGKGGHTREIPVPAAVERALAVYLGEHAGHHGPLLRTFTTGKALAPVTLSREFRELAYRAGVKGGAWDGVGCHSLRHTAACDVLEGGADLATVSELLGHANPATTGIYLRRARQDRLRAAIEGRSYGDVA